MLNAINIKEVILKWLIESLVNESLVNSSLNYEDPNFIHDLKPNTSIDHIIQIKYLNSWKIDDIAQFLDKLDMDSNYIANIEF